MKKISFINLTILSTIFLFLSCSNDDTPAYIHDHEGIHEVIIQRTNLDGTNPIEYEFVEGNIMGDVITLTNGNTYNFEIIALNAHEEDGDHNLIQETIEAVEEHFFLYSKSNDLAIDLERTDDATSTRNDGTKIGVKTRITANAVSSGNLQFELKHQPTEVDDQANNNFGSSIGGATDLLAVFPVVVE